MLTHNDVTVQNARQIFESCVDLPIEHWGFKDIGLMPDEISKLVGAMKEAGKTTFLEVVTLNEDECMRGAQIAVDNGFDYLMGTVFYDSVFQYLQNQRKKYFPFCGQIVGHPSKLKGTPEEIVYDAFSLQLKGVDGLDLLAYRHMTSAEEIAIKVVANLKIPVVVAGSIDSFERINFVKDLQPWGFTIGSAFFDKRFLADGSFKDQLITVYECMHEPVMHKNNKAIQKV